MKNRPAHGLPTEPSDPSSTSISGWGGKKNPEKPELFHVMELLSIIPATSGRGHLHFTGDHEDRSVSMTEGIPLYDL